MESQEDNGSSPEEKVGDVEKEKEKVISCFRMKNSDQVCNTLLTWPCLKVFY